MSNIWLGLYLNFDVKIINGNCVKRKQILKQVHKYGIQSKYVTHITFN